MRNLSTILYTTILLGALVGCGELDGAAVNVPGAGPEGTFGVSAEFDGPYLNDQDGPITGADDERVLTVDPGGVFYVRLSYTDDDGVAALEVALTNGDAGILDPAQSFFELSEPGVSEPSCEVNGETEVTCIYEVRVSEDAVPVGADIAYTFSGTAVDTLGNASEPGAQGYVAVTGDAQCEDPVVVPDTALKAALRDALSLGEGEAITCEALASLETFEAFNEGIKDLEGLQFATGLMALQLSFNEIESIGELAGLTSLVALDLNANLVSDLGPLRDLVALEDLALTGNVISDVTPLRDLVRLEQLSLAFNNITDLGPLVESAGLGEGDTLFVEENPADVCPGSEGRQAIEALQERGVTVLFTEPEGCS